MLQFIKTKNKMNKEANKIAKHIIDISGVNVFDDSRERKYIEMRSLLTFILRNHCGMTFQEIKGFFISKGKKYNNHVTAIHSFKSFEVHRRYNPNLDKYFHLVLLRLKNKSKLRKALINHIVDNTQEKDLKKLLNIVDNLKDGKEQTKEKANTPV